MRLSGLVVAANLLISATLFAQHTSGTSVPSTSSASSSSSSSTSSSSASISHPSSSSNSAGSSSSSNSGASHSSYSGGSSSSSLASSASSHNSVGTVSHLGSTDAAASHTTPQASRFNSERAVREPNSDPKRKIAGETGKLNPPSTNLPPAHANAPPEKKSFFSRLRHPFKPKPVRTADFKRPPPCRKEPCACPPGESRNGKGMCVAVVVSDLCEPGQYWNGGACSGTLACQPGNFWNGTTCVQEADRCETFDARGAMLAHELRSIRGPMDRVCLQDPNGQQCGELTTQHDMALSRYRILLNEAPLSCRVTLPDPLSL